MSYFNYRPRAYSKPTREELQELNHCLSKLTKHEPRLILGTAKSQQPDIAHVLTEAMVEANIIPSFHSQIQPAQHPQHQAHSQDQVVFLDLTGPETGLPTPIDMSEDSEMSDIENVHSQLQYPSQQPLTISSFSLHAAQKRPSKRKFLADKDDNIPTASPGPLSVSSKKPRHNCIQSNHSSYQNPMPTAKSSCLNCGRYFTPADNLHDCIYHPGAWITFPPALITNCDPDRKTGWWSCCRSSHQNPGCLISRHRDAVKEHDMILSKQDMEQHSRFSSIFLSGS